MGGRIFQQMENMSKQRGMGYAGNHNPIAKADEAGWFVRDKFKKEHNVALRSLLWDHKKKKSDSFAPKIGSSIDKFLANWPTSMSSTRATEVRNSRDVLGLRAASILVEAKKVLDRRRKKEKTERRTCAKSWA